MLNIICFVFSAIGCLNWLSIGMLQFDFVAGIFGTQSNIFSRLIYVLIGICIIWLIISAIRNKGLSFSIKKKTQHQKQDLLSDVI